jgi:nitrous oxidase accessory protein NosD
MKHSASRWLVAVTCVFACAQFASVAGAAEIAVAAGESIQAAIDKATDGDTIKVAAGVFAENLSVSKPITIEGAGWEKTTVGVERMGGFTQRQKEEFFAAIEATNDKQERARIALAFVSTDTKPALTVRNTKDVTVRGLRFRGPPSGSAEGGLTADTLVTFDNAAGTLSACAMIGPFMNGVVVREGSEVTIEKSLVAAMWGTGVTAAPRAKLRLVESDVRNCYHRCVTLATDAATVERSRISGSAWHGVRYDRCSPTVRDNLIFGNARFGVYAAGGTKGTVTGNVLARNEMSGIICWDRAEDRIEGNTIVANREMGLVANGDAKPRVAKNVIALNPVGVWCGEAQGRDKQKIEPAVPTLEANFFWSNRDKDLGVKTATQPLPTGNESADPKFAAADKQDYALAKDSPARAKGAGVAEPLAMASPFALQPEEKSMVPESETRDYSKWKRVATAQ